MRDVEFEEVIGHEELAELRTPAIERLLECVVRAADIVPEPHSPLAAEGVARRA